ncbi:MAG: ABC transporter substrate-binding protein [Odoribacter sp.]|nr:ABC transporter substrate-binding protein [Odoribacter sp.]
MKNVFNAVIKILLVIFVTIMLLILIMLVRSEYRTIESEGVEVTDMLGRSVIVPEQVDSIVCLKASAIRLVCYAGGADMICGVEECELRGNPYTHIYANPKLKERRVIGPMMGGDAELILSVSPDLIFTTCSTVNEADMLQRRCGVPVIALEYGNLASRRDEFYSSLKLISNVLGTESRVDSLIGYIDGQIGELDRRSERELKHEPSPVVYVCGISYKGKRGLDSTDPNYAALQFINGTNAAAGVDSKLVSEITGTTISLEQLLLWNPDILFVDNDGLDLVMSDLERLNIDRNKLYLIWPYNNIHSNFEVMLLNSWFMGKVLYPEQFADIDIAAKRDEIMYQFLRSDIGDSLVATWGEYRKI